MINTLELQHETLAIDKSYFSIPARPLSECDAYKLCITEGMLIDALNKQLTDLLTSINTRETGNQVPTRKEMIIQEKLVRCICDLKKPTRRRNLGLKHWHGIVASILSSPVK